jgi:signal transduction histidine kinase
MMALVTVRERGNGIDSDILPRLFTKFTTKSDQGTGLGLYITKSIIEAHGGQIWAQNNYDVEKGATFSFTLPLAK